MQPARATEQTCATLRMRKIWIILPATNRADIVDARGTPTFNTIQSADLVILNQDCILVPGYCRQHVAPNLINREVP